MFDLRLFSFFDFLLVQTLWCIGALQDFYKKSLWPFTIFAPIARQYLHCFDMNNCIVQNNYKPKSFFKLFFNVNVSKFLDLHAQSE